MEFCDPGSTFEGKHATQSGHAWLIYHCIGLTPYRLLKLSEAICTTLSFTRMALQAVFGCMQSAEPAATTT